MLQCAYMKNNKGFAPIIIALIIAGALVVGGGVYWLGKNKGEDKKIVDNQGIDNNIQNNNSDCLPTTDPWIRVISPNGGENYQMGENITIKWKTCNLSSSNHLRAALQRQPPFPDSEWQIPILFGNLKEGQIVSSLNDGEQVVILDSAHDVVPASYKLCISEYVTLPGQDVIQGCSGNSFAINS